ncbi:MULTISPECIES: hypothetical protein [Pseudomonas]|uniref:hypothetical protein n=1 Tax=Pseudomonas nitroreducens TaxID=46680 RepID=UPI001E63D152|nr:MULTISPECIES: hypothetical protein [Pseudomonas]MCE4073325.1 hypothetical protein [Pseudomonas nitritireducens]MCE4079621.1 hypothetical protein [Pseudomonas nitroreducens]
MRLEKNLIDFGKKLPEYVFVDKCKEAYFVERSVLYSYDLFLRILKAEAASGISGVSICFWSVSNDDFEEIEKINVDFECLKDAWGALTESYNRLTLEGGDGRLLIYPGDYGWVIYEEVLEEVGVLAIFNDGELMGVGLTEGDVVSNKYLIEQSAAGVFKGEYVDELISSYRCSSI